MLFNPIIYHHRKRSYLYTASYTLTVRRAGPLALGKYSRAGKELEGVLVQCACHGMKHPRLIHMSSPFEAALNFPRHAASDPALLSG